jgi:ribulose 1,5-bisphosphate synthetase/thiazole synthase
VRCLKLWQRIEKQVESSEVGEVEFDDSYDIIVVGLGTAGAMAALAAARQGCRVLGIESLHCMGGTHTAGAIQNYYFGCKGGLFEQVDLQIREQERDGYPIWGGSSAELKKYHLEQLAREQGIELSYESSVIGVYRSGKQVKGVRWVSPAGVHTVASRVLIDATGNADICAMAGCATRQGRAVDGKGQPYSNVMEIASANRVGKFYTDSGYLDPTDASAVTQAILDSSTVPPQLREYYDGHDRMLRLTPILGVREGRFIVGEENVTLETFQNEQFTTQPLFYAYSNLDNHSKDVAFESTQFQDWIVAASLWGLNFSVPIPLGALIPQGFEGVLAAGRCLALDHDMAACVRMNRDMQKCGEAAGTAAALAVRHSMALKEIPYEELCAHLTATGCLDTQGLRFVDTSVPLSGSNGSTVYRAASWIEEKEAIRAGLAADKSGIAIWSAWRMGESINAELRSWATQTSDVLLRKNSAIALGLQNDALAVPVLREMARRRDSYVPRTSRKYNQSHGIAAIYLLGKLGDREIVPDLLEILADRAAFIHSPLDGEFIMDDEDFFAQYFTFSLMALLRITQAHPALRGPVVAQINRIVGAEDFSLSVTLKGSAKLRHPLRETILEVLQ